MVTYIWLLIVITNAESMGDHKVLVGSYKTPTVCEARAKEYNKKPDVAFCQKTELRD